MKSAPSTSSQQTQRRAQWCRGGAVLVILVVAGYWWAKGAHMGWSQNLIPTVATDEVTGLEHITYEKGFMPGIDLLATGAAGAVVLWLVSLFLARRTYKKSTHP